MSYFILHVPYCTVYCMILSVQCVQYLKTNNTIHGDWYFRKDARLPEQLQRAMAAEAEASREARAKVTPNNIY